MIRSKRSGKRYALFDIEATQPLPEIPLPSHMTGIAVLVRRNGRPVHFWMEALPKSPAFTTQELERKICEKSGNRLLKACIRDELTPRIKVNQLPSITVAVCTRDRTELLSRCLRSLLAMEPSAFGTPVSLEIRVVDNAPATGKTRDLASSLTGVRYAVEPRPGLDFARNRALKEAQGDLLAYVDDDVVVDPGWLTGLMEAWIEHPDAACFTGQVLPYELATEAQIIFEKRGGFRRGFDTVRYGRTLDGHPANPCSAGIFGTGANMAFQRRILKHLNGFDEALDTGPPLPAAGDHDIFYRLIRAGYSIVYKPEFLVFHEHRRGLETLTRQYWNWGLGVMASVDKWGKIDPSQGSKLRYLKRNWFSAHLPELISSLLGQAPVPFYMVVGEIAGAIVGLMGEYSRSVKRIARIRKRFPFHPESGQKLEIRHVHTRDHGRKKSNPINPTNSTNSINPTNRFHMAHFKPWEILHLDLRQGVPELASRAETGGTFVVFWWHSIPLGQHWIAAKQLPMCAAELREYALTAIEPAVASHLLGTSFAASSPNRSSKTHHMDSKTLPKLDRPLQRLESHLSSPAVDTPYPTVSAVVCTKERPEQLKRCLSSLQGLSRKANEIVVVDNAPRSDAARQIVSQFPGIRYLHEPRPGLDVARNGGIDNTSGEIVAFTDDDATVHPDWIARICQGFKDPAVMAVTGLVLPAELETEAQFLFETHWGFGRGYLRKSFGKQFFQRARSRGAPVWEIGAGANMAFRRKVFDKVGLFDERLDVGAAGCSGDSEMWYRILGQGWTCRYEPAAVVYHDHRRDMEALDRQLYHYMRGHVAALLIQFEKHHHRGNLYSLFNSLPWYYAGLTLKGAVNGFSGRERTLHTEIQGCLSGLRFYLFNRRMAPSIPRIKPPFRTGGG
ncbi:MAG: hypothetical protein QG552_3707 [Thermodesulfobacteriota bacterium]|nr:hypothetical protein [Thermodesulfobacteriota bacterium]